MYKLVIQDDEGKTTVVPVIRDEITVGRKEGNTIRLTERNVSRRHARIVRSNGAVAIEDLDSYNGIRVNGTRIQGRCSIKESDRVQIGDYVIELKAEVESADSDQPTQRVRRAEVDPMGKTPPPELAQPTTVPLPLPGRHGGGAARQRARGLADTDPKSALRTPAEAAESALAPQTQHARLVILSTNFAGREFPLDKPALVIGRTEDNDIWINHRSISRHHAKIVHENGRYAIVDLQSSNGVRVNGEEYGKVELRRSDTIDLGHVRLRFIEPGEDFVFGRDAQAVDVEPGGSRGLLWAGLAVLVIGAAAVAFFVGRGGSSATAPSASASNARPVAATGTANAAAGSTGATAAAAPKADAMSAAHATAGIADKQAAKLRVLLAQAGKSVAAENWAQAQAAAKRALVIDPTNARAQALDKQAGQELASLRHYQAFEKAVRQSDYHTAALEFRQIAPASVYRVKGQSDYDRARSAYERVVGRRARRLARGGKCQELRRLAKAAGTLWPEARAAVTQYPCRRAVALSHNPGHKPNKRKKQGSRAGQGGGSSHGGGKGGGGASVAELIAQSKTAAKAGQFGRALRLCESALRKKHGDGEALMVCAISACNLKNAGKAKHYSAQIHGDKKGFVRQICLRNGVNLQ